MSIGLGINLALRGGASSAPIVPPSFADSSLLFISPHATQAVWVESGTQSSPETHALVDGNLVGCVEDLSPTCTEVTSTTAGRPALATDAAGGQCLTWSSGKFLVASNSKYTFNTIQTTLIGTIAIRVTPTTDGVLGYLVDSSNGTGASIGFMIRREVGNTISVGIAAGGTWRYQKTTTGTVLAAGGTTTIIFTMDGTTGRIYLGGAAAETVAVGGAAIAANTAQTYDVRIGQQADSTDSFVGTIGAMVIDDVAWDATQRAEFIAWNPAKTNASLLRKTGSEGDPYDYVGWHTILDGKILGSFFQDRIQVPVTAVTVATDPIGTWVNQVANTNRNAVAASDAARPLYEADGGGVWDGSDDNLSFSAWPLAGNFHLFLVCSNSDATNGSHPLAVQGGANYIAMCGANYVSQPSAVVPHLDASYAVDAPLVSSAGLNLIEVVRTPTGMYCRVNGTGSYAFVAAETGVPCGFNRMGTPSFANWNQHGSIKAVWRNRNDMRGAAADAVCASIMGQWGL